MIQANHFYDLLDNLAGQFFTNRSAVCVGKDFGVQISLNAKEYFSVIIVSEKLDADLAVLGVLLDDSAHTSRNGFTFVIYIDPDEIEGDAFKIFASIIIAHEICHFAYYYDLFIRLGDNTGIEAQSYFTYAISATMMGAITEEKDSTSQTIFDEHNLEDLVKNTRKYPKKHFTKGKESRLNYHKFFDNFLDHLHFEKMLVEYKNKRENKNS